MAPTLSPSPVIELLARATESATSSPTASRPKVYTVIGLILAISSGLFIGTSFVLKKVGLLKANVKYNEAAGEGYGYLKNAWWWSGMTLMIIGEICNFVAYAFVDAVLVTPMGALSVVVTTILSAIFLKERLSFVGKIGCFNCIVGSIVIVLNAPSESTVSDIRQMKDYVIAPGFLSYAGVIILGCLFVALWAGPRYGKKSMLVYLSICSLIGGLSVVATQGLGAAIVAQIGGTPQFNYWFLYVLLVFVIATLLTEIVYLNKALNLFNAALVTPTYYVFFTSSTMVTSCVLFRGLKGADGTHIGTIILGFLQICSGVILLQLSKSAKDVPDAAVFKGDLDQIRTVAEQEEGESEPKADAIRGAAALLRTLSKSRLRKEAEEAKRVQEERLEPIGENEQVEWDGLRRRKTVISMSDNSVREPRTRTVHPPLGMSHFPNEMDDDARTHNPEDDFGVNIFSDIRKRTLSVLHPRRHASTTSSHPGSVSHTMPLSEMHGAPPRIPSNTSTNDFAPHLPEFANETLEKFQPYARTNSQAESSDFSNQDTNYKGSSVPSTSIRWVPEPVTPRYTRSPSNSRNASPENTHNLKRGGSPLDPPPAIYDAGGQHTRRQFSFQNVFSRRPGEDTRSSSVSSSANRFGRKSRGGPVITEEERLGLVSGDARAAAAAAAAADTRPVITSSGTIVSAGSRNEDVDHESGVGRVGANPDPGIRVQRLRGGASGGFEQSYNYDDGYDYNDDDDDREDGYAPFMKWDRDDGGPGTGGKAFV